MKRIKHSALILILIFAAMMTLQGCVATTDPEKDTSVIENAYLVDKETGEFTSVAIIQNNEKDTIRENMYMGFAYDENGESIASYEIEENGMVVDCCLFDVINWLGSGEKTVIAHSSRHGVSHYNEGHNIQDFYTSIPDKLEWKASGLGYDSMLKPHGLSITDYTETYSEFGYLEYEVTIHNGSETDYTYNSTLDALMSDTRGFIMNIVAVYRDSEGNIRDFEEMRPEYEKDGGIAAGSDATYKLYANDVLEADLTPEFYLTVEWASH